MERKWAKKWIYFFVILIFLMRHPELVSGKNKTRCLNDIGFMFSSQVYDYFFAGAFFATAFLGAAAFFAGAAAFFAAGFALAVFFAIAFIFFKFLVSF